MNATPLFPCEGEDAATTPGTRPARRAVFWPLAWCASLALVCAVAAGPGQARGLRAPRWAPSAPVASDVSPVTAAQDPFSGSRAPTASTDEPCERVIVTLLKPPRLPADERRSAIRATQASVLGALPAAEWTLSHRYASVSALAGCVTRSGRQALRALPEVVGVGDDVPMDRALSDSVEQISADLVHEIGLTGEGMTVAVIDSGIDASHPQLADSVAAERCYCDSAAGGCCPNGEAFQEGPGSAWDAPSDGHGTHVSGIVTMNETWNAVGVAPDADVVAVKVVGVDDDGALVSGYASSVVAALDWIADQRPDVDVVNMSIGSRDRYAGSCEGRADWIDAIDAAVAPLVERGTIVVSSTGNDEDKQGIEAPACLENVIGVGGVMGWDVPMPMSNSSPALDLLAPGSGIESTHVGGAFLSRSGTSFAAPHVAATAALVLQAADVAGRPRPAQPELLALLSATGLPVEEPSTGVERSRIDAAAAVDAYPTAPWVRDVRILPGDRPNGASVCGVVSGFEVELGKPVLAESFGVADVAVLLPEEAAELVEGVAPVEGTCRGDGSPEDPRRCSVFTVDLQVRWSSFPLHWGAYELAVGPDIEDPFGRLLDGDRDNLGGEPEDDPVPVRFSILPESRLCDRLALTAIRAALEPEVAAELQELEGRLLEPTVPLDVDTGDLSTVPLDAEQGDLSSVPLATETTDLSTALSPLLLR